jgi:protein SCO1/2
VVKPATAGALGLALLTLVLALSLLRFRPAGPPVLSPLPDFSFTDSRGTTVSLRSLAGKVWIADFIFTRCAGTCPLMTARMARLQKKFPRATFVSFTVDPAHDTEAILAGYAKGFSESEAWHFVTGPKYALYQLSTKGFKLAALELPPGERSFGDGPFLHSSRFVLVDGKGRVRGYYDSTDEAAMTHLEDDIPRVDREAL